MTVATWRRDFPALRPRAGDASPVYLDSACMSLVPRPVLEAMEAYYADFPGCAGRSLHRFAEQVGREYEEARAAFGRFFGRQDPAGVVFLRNSTEAINLVAQGISWKPGERVLISDREHNSNLIVWQRLASERGVELEILPLSEDGSMDPDELERKLAGPVRLVSLYHTSNLDGSSLPVREIAERAHDRGAEVLIDGCQAAPHESVDLAKLGVDYYAISGHKMLGPTGTGALVSTPELLGGLRPLAVGGETVEWSTLESHELRPAPYRFEAGLQNYAGVLGAHAALEYLTRAGLDQVAAQQRRVNELITSELEDEPRVHVLGPPESARRPSIYAFTIDGVDPHDAALFLDEGFRVMVRSGMHCVHSFYRRRGLSGNVRASFYLYTDRHDAETFVRGVRELLERVPVGRATGTSAATPGSGPRAVDDPPHGVGSTGAAARSARPPRTAVPGRAASGGGSG
jgi:cysteine desulfurase / selenocysteine lyase